MLGICQRALEMTLEYVKDRKQFGVPVGSFQAVSHRCAQMLLHTESARSATYFAAWAADADPERFPEAAALAAAAAAQAGREVTASAIQAHGGIGFTWEADVHWLYKRAQLDYALLGGVHPHRATLARLAAQRVAVPGRVSGRPPERHEAPQAPRSPPPAATRSSAPAPRLIPTWGSQPSTRRALAFEYVPRRSRYRAEPGLISLSPGASRAIRWITAALPSAIGVGSVISRRPTPPRRARRTRGRERRSRRTG